MRSLNLYRTRPNSLWDFMSELESAFDSTLNQRSGTQENSLKEMVHFSPSVDVTETEDSYLISADLPGLSEKDIKIDVHSGSLVISGERRNEFKKESGDLKVYERSFGKFRRSFALPKDTNAENIQARFDNGVLEVLIPKVAKETPKSISIETSKGGLFSRLLGEKKANSQESH